MISPEDLRLLTSTAQMAKGYDGRSEFLAQPTDDVSLMSFLRVNPIRLGEPAGADMVCQRASGKDCRGASHEVEDVRMTLLDRAFS